MSNEEERKKLAKEVLLANGEGLCQKVQKAFEKEKITEGELYIAMACAKLLRKTFQATVSFLDLRPEEAKNTEYKGIFKTLKRIY